MSNKISLYAKFFLAGIISGTSISFPYLLPIFFFGYYLFIVGLIDNKLPFLNFFSGWLFGFGFFITSMHWIINPFLVYDEHLILAPFALFIFPLILGLFFSVPSILITKFLYIFPLKNDFILSKCFLISLFLFFAEYLRSFIFGGLPFNLSAHIWTFNANFIKIASFIGVFGLSFLTIFWFTLTSVLIKKKSKLYMLPLLLFPVFLISFSVFEKKKFKENKNKILIRVVQPNILQKEKWNRIHFQDHIDKLLELSLLNDETKNKNLVVVWPEVALTVYLNEQIDLINYLKKNITENTTIITGGLRRSFEGNNFKVYNSMFIIQRDNFFFYDKKRLVPFGEFVPFRSILDFWKLTPGETDFSKGETNSYFGFLYGEKELIFQPSICYEAIFQTFNYKKIMMLINVTNDAWFGSTTGPKQHLAASIFRSVEKGVPLIRSANSGISVITNSDGKIIKKLGLNKSGFLQSEIGLGDNSTFFMKHKNSVLLLGIIFILILNLALDSYIKKRKSLKI